MEQFTLAVEQNSYEFIFRIISDEIRINDGCSKSFLFSWDDLFLHWLIWPLIIIKSKLDCSLIFRLSRFLLFVMAIEVIRNVDYCLLLHKMMDWWSKTVVSTACYFSYKIFRFFSPKIKLMIERSLLPITMPNEHLCWVINIGPIDDRWVPFL